ncbi:hypothetical protein F5Y09DRAFT_302184 [Xylaria sp. FL1042]|nr:hypothetical protein F5Y09DRAFT_302184 [Xylaria sp. FL1042]
MARRGRALRPRQSTARRRALFRGRDRSVCARVGSAVINRFLLDVRSRAASALEDRANERTPEVVEESLPHPSLETPARVLRIRTCHFHNVLYSADDPTGVLAAQSSRKRIYFGGVYRDYDSNIVFSSSEDLVYFDEIPDFVKSGIYKIHSSAAENPSEIRWIALDIERLPEGRYQPIIGTIDNPALSDIFLVVTRDDIRGLVEDVQPDHWGFKEIPEAGLRERAPTLYENGCRIVESFNGILYEGRMRYIFVFDWGQHGKA